MFVLMMLALVADDQKIPASVPIAKVLANRDAYEGKTLNVSGWGFCYEPNKGDLRFSMLQDGRIVAFFILNAEGKKVGQKIGIDVKEKVIIRAKFIGGADNVVEFRDAAIIHSFDLRKP